MPILTKKFSGFPDLFPRRGAVQCKCKAFVLGQSPCRGAVLCKCKAFASESFL